MRIKGMQYRVVVTIRAISLCWSMRAEILGYGMVIDLAVRKDGMNNMDILEKILEEIEEATFQEDAPIYAGDKEIDGYVRESVVKEIICSHMNNLQDADAEEKSILCTVGEDGVLTPYDDTYDVIIHCSNKEDQNRTIELIKNFNWIPVSERLPEPDKIVYVTVHCSEWTSDHDSDWVAENEKVHHEEKYIVNVGYVDEDWHWTAFNDDGYEVCCDEEFGTDKGCVYSVVTAWLPLPEPYKAFW